MCFIAPKFCVIKKLYIKSSQDMAKICHIANELTKKQKTKKNNYLGWGTVKRKRTQFSAPLRGYIQRILRICEKVIKNIIWLSSLSKVASMTMSLSVEDHHSVFIGFWDFPMNFRSRFKSLRPPNSPPLVTVSMLTQRVLWIMTQA